MPVDPEVQVFLDELESLDAPPLHSLTVEQARRDVAAGTAQLGEPEPVGRIEDRRVPGPLGEIPIRICTPEGHGPFPVIVYYHGGGWTVCDIQTHHALCCSIAKAAECIVISVDYRLGPEHKYPAAVEDAYAAAEWVFARAADFGGDARRVAVGGDSAGGNLATVVCLRARDSFQAGNRAAFRPVLQALIYPVVDFRFDTASYHQCAEGYLLTRNDMKWFWANYLARAEDGSQPYASPLRAENLGDLPPALVITAEYDPLRDEGEAYATRLSEAGVPVTLIRYEGMIHGFLRHTARFDRARVALHEMAGVLKQAFAQGKGSGIGD